MSLSGRRITLVIAGGIAAYKSLDLIRRLRERDAAVRAILTEAARHFVTPLAVATLTGNRAYTDLFSLTEESEMGHLRLAQDADLVVVAPATETTPLPAPAAAPPPFGEPPPPPPAELHK